MLPPAGSGGGASRHGGAVCGASLSEGVAVRRPFSQVTSSLLTLALLLAVQPVEQSIVPNATPPAQAAGFTAASKQEGVERHALTWLKRTTGHFFHFFHSLNARLFVTSKPDSLHDALACSRYMCAGRCA